MISSQKSYLIVCCRYIGDVLLTTPLALSIKTAEPDAVVDYLVFQGTEKVLAKNKFIRKIHTIKKDTTGIAVLVSLFKKYDVSIAANASDRNTLIASITGKYSIGLTNGWRKEWWKGILLSMHYVWYDLIHAVPTTLMPLRMLGIKPIYKVVMGYDDDDRHYACSNLPSKKFILMHPYSMKEFKYWPAKKWGELAKLLLEQTDFIPVFTATPAPGDAAFLNEILSYSPSETVVYPCSFTQFAAGLETCEAYIGIDTAATHIAAAMEVTVIAIYGSSLTRYWGPWPNDCSEFSPFLKNRGIQRSGNITIIQKDWECVPCNKEQCRISTHNRPECLDAITPDQVLAEIQKHVIRTHSK